MQISAIYANLCCTNIQRSARWFETLFNRDPDRKPMPGLLEGRHRNGCGFQLYEDAEGAGDGTVQLIVKDVRSEHERLRGIGPGQVELGGDRMVLRLRDPDGNLVMLTEERGA
ncbi:hypothetical protein P1J78_08685 [Psychromarinibacter sp. C21-152]|uniref:Glyoxalase-like domain-containing protein n=1 Tax=Psychromarinibacter sediminicola TaxID=3033385 RepID=A0AAE3T9A2_9RHOB|nr:hypothetical protein [Psychromarinibacter sediminicola]MDF0600804.1 hypothetical protein [Psychromarinibacter sediminicola]